MASFAQPEDDSVSITGSTRPFDDDGYLGYDPRLSSQRFDSFVDSESLKDSATDSQSSTAPPFIAEVDKNYWKAIADLIPNEVPAIEKKIGTKDTEKKLSILVVQGPRPGKPTELSRMRQILLKLKHNTSPHLKPSPPDPAPSKDAKPSTSAPPKAAVVAATPEAVVAVS
ncbi:hypothetical protein ACFX13_042215 [Malus domestica]|uniref:Clathrin light chain n=1 Tax=Malus domestica TaxID=3750 RepID=A0A498JGF0_MALDO|nr:hypothetical protein DVH24_024294 [Malus domestica]